MKVCSNCKVTKPLEEFAYSVKKKNYNNICLSCTMRNKKIKKTRNYNDVRVLNTQSRKDIP